MGRKKIRDHALTVGLTEYQYSYLEKESERRGNVAMGAILRNALNREIKESEEKK